MERVKTAHPADNISVLPILVDLDGTLACSLWTPETRSRKIGPPIEAARERIHNLVREVALEGLGRELHIHTSRPRTDKSKIRRWLNLNGYNGVFSEIHCDKVLGERYVDDKAVNPEDVVWWSRV